MADAPPAEIKTKLDEQRHTKGDLSYSSWASSGPANSDVQPVKLAEGAAAAGAASGGQAAAQGASTWNAAGTFEERDLTAWAKQRLPEMLVGLTSGSVAVTGCKSITGHANIWFIRGQKRCGFDVDLELSWQQQTSSSSAANPDGPRGTVKLPSVSPDDLDDLDDLGMVVSLDSSGSAAAGDDAGAAALRDARGLKQPLQEALTRFLAELRDK